MVSSFQQGGIDLGAAARPDIQRTFLHSDRHCGHRRSLPIIFEGALMTVAELNKKGIVCRNWATVG